jgi:hypothetical protein
MHVKQGGEHIDARSYMGLGIRNVGELTDSTPDTDTGELTDSTPDTDTGGLS